MFQISTSSGKNAKNSEMIVHPTDRCGKSLYVEKSNSGSRTGRIGPRHKCYIVRRYEIPDISVNKVHTRYASS